MPDAKRKEAWLSAVSKLVSCLLTRINGRSLTRPEARLATPRFKWDV
jgi:hypothetical protein